MFQLKWLWARMKGFRKRYIFALCSTVLLSMLSLGNSVITASIMDLVFDPLQATGVVTEEIKSQLVVLVAVLIGFTLFRTGFGYFSVMTYEGCSQKLIYGLRRDLYKNIKAQSISWRMTQATIKRIMSISPVRRVIRSPVRFRL